MLSMWDRIRNKPYQARYRRTQWLRRSSESEVTETEDGVLYRDEDGRQRRDTVSSVESSTPVSSEIYDPIAQRHFFWINGLQVFSFSGADSSNGVGDLCATTLSLDDGSTIALPNTLTGQSASSIGEKEIAGVPCRGFEIDRSKYVIEYWLATELQLTLRSIVSTKTTNSTYLVYNIRLVNPESTIFAVPEDLRLTLDWPKKQS